MKLKTQILQSLLITTGILLVATGCSSLPWQSESGKEMSATGPTVLNPHMEPATIELDRNLHPKQKPEILADVKDFSAKITDVIVQFTHVPLEVPMEHVSGTTWRAELTPSQLQMLAVSGKTEKYEANVVARNDRGQISVSSSPVTLRIKAPDLARSKDTA